MRFWLPGLHEVSGKYVKGVGGWICDEEYQVYKPVTATSFVLTPPYLEPLLKAYATDINRIAVASFETVSNVLRSSTFPKSTAWLVIKTYYAAFFAAHALLRILGTSCAPLEREQIKSVTAVADIYGYAPPSALNRGLYRLTYSSATNELEGVCTKSPKAGAHEAFWQIFHDRIDRLSTEVLSAGAGTSANRQLVSTKLAELDSNLCFASPSRGSWLSVIRNAVNYDQKHATWYPYAGQEAYLPQLFDKASEWKADPVELDLASHEGKDLRRFQVTCNFIIAMLRASVTEMARRCSGGRSFHTYGSVAFLNLSEQRARRTT